MQNAKDSFYIALRNRLAVVNPTRLITVRGVQRPGIVVEDAEAPALEPMRDTFVLRWTAEAWPALPLKMVGLLCEVRYGTGGSQANGGLDRGRALAEMDRELLCMLAPPSTPKMSYASVPAAALLTQVFWDEPQFGPMQTLRDQVSRVATVQVFSIEEPADA